ncbi:MAG: efflux RND transporter periplasmic adaptor subunit [Candidatus Gastranaerophilales bacterium]|nr:efflux RND transporter periplasmic adaptor subunit [Candidatus Gastranaerophilales bacterium]
MFDKKYMLILAMSFVVFASGCNKQEPVKKIAIVDVKTIARENIIDSIESTGRINSTYSVDIVARIDGYLQKRFFKEGADVKKGALLFQIEPQTYAARLNEAGANLRNSQASLKNAQINLKRAAQLVKDDYISKAEYDEKLAARDMDKAAVDSNRASVVQAGINYGYTKIYSPIDGKIGKILITEGNLVGPSVGTLATVVSTNPIQVDFNLKSKEFLAVKKASQMKEFDDIKVKIKLADDTIYPIPGKIKFVDNQLDPSTGTVLVRATFDNPNNLLVQGDYVKVVCYLAQPRNVITVPQEAVLESAKGKYVYTVNKDKKADIAFIEVSDSYDGNWIVTGGLQEGDVVAVRGLQQLQPDIPVITSGELKASKKQQSAEQELDRRKDFGQKVITKIKKIFQKGAKNEQ